ncbi:hypothetical protein Q4R82_18200, partial [Morganella morganii]
YKFLLHYLCHDVSDDIIAYGLFLLITQCAVNPDIYSFPDMPFISDPAFDPCFSGNALFVKKMFHIR